MNDRWRVALAGLVAALAIPFLIIDSPSPAEGVETIDEAAPLEATTSTTVAEVAPQTEIDSDDVVVVSAEFGPDIDRLARRAGDWNVARVQAIADGLVTPSALLPPSDTDLSLLPYVPQQPPEPEVIEPEPEGTAPEVVEPEPEVAEPEPEGTAPEVVEPEPEVAEPEPEGTESEVPGPEPEAVEPEVAEPEPIIEELVPEGPNAPAQVNGRVPPPSGGPTAAQWDAVRKCESTHNYGAISPSGLYRGAYQFSQQTWDWVAGIHQPHLVGIDPVNAEPAWQDVMAYTLYAMRGWNQWPICGKNLL